MSDALQTVIIGTGALGSALAHRLSEVGYPILAIVSRQKDRAARLAAEAGARHALDLDQQLPDATALALLCVPDDVIEPTARRLARSEVWRGAVAGHTSGALTADCLAPLAGMGAATMSFHPLQTFSKHAVTSFDGIYFGLEGESKAVLAGQRLARALGGIPISVPAGAKTQYHLAASMASNLFVGLTSMACDVMTSIGVNPGEAMKILHPLIRQTSRNMAAHGPAGALTGPGARGDAKTIKKHLGILSSHFPSYRAAYLALVDQTVDLARKAGSLTEEKAHHLIQELHAPEQNHD